MLLSSVRFRNYACFVDTGDVSLSTRFNLVLGRNNSGKSAFLAGIAVPSIVNPHRGLDKYLSAPKQRMTLTFRITGRELVDKLMGYRAAGAFRFTALPKDAF